jgi:alpha-galactosidase
VLKDNLEKKTMTKIVFIGAGSIIFAKNLIGDCLLTDCLQDSEIALVDINQKHLQLSYEMICNLNDVINQGRAKITAHLDRQEALRGADFVITAIHIGGYERIVSDFEIPLKYGLQQTYADTLGIGGIFRGLRTTPVILDIARDIEDLCPDAWLLNYVNPMAIITGTVLKAGHSRTVGLCHSVQICAQTLLEELGLHYPEAEYKIAGVNHQAWLLELSSGGRDLYPEVKAAAALQENHPDHVRLEIMKRFGYYVTESSIHTAEYTPYFIKKAYPDLAASFGLDPLMYRSWANDQNNFWEKTVLDMIGDKNLKHERTHEYSSHIMEAMLNNEPIVIGGNVLNQGCIHNLPQNACVEVPCTVDGRGLTPHVLGDLPPQCAGLNRTYLNPVELTSEAQLSGKKEYIYHAALLDPHTAAELTTDEIIRLCDEMLEANQAWIQEFR